MMSTDNSENQDCLAALAVHRGAIDHDGIIMKSLQSMGVSIEIEGTYKCRCIRPSKDFGGLGAPEGSVGGANVSDAAGSEDTKAHTEGVLNSAEEADGPQGISPATFILPTQPALYGENPTQDPCGEVVFTVELTRISGLKDTLSIDIRRLRGGLRSYGFVYDTLRALVAS
ncbi:hypothetical protein BD779DRAFT_1516654 [Infundibulicybe gibba]|nr:hypothetical protein BD779DRAFT_1516654 [Infundibulicybe gibba]